MGGRVGGFWSPLTSPNLEGHLRIDFLLHWLEQAIVDYKTKCYRPPDHYLSLFKGAVVEITRLRRRETILTVEEAMEKDNALLEIIQRVQGLPAITISCGSHPRFTGLITKAEVVSILQEYGFNDAPYDQTPSTQKTRVPQNAPLSHQRQGVVRHRRRK